MATTISSSTINWRLLRLGSVIGLALLAALVLGHPYPAAAQDNLVSSPMTINASLTATLTGSVEMTTTSDGTSSRPLGVIVATFDAQSVINENGNYNVIAWETTSELNMLGFNLWRGTSASAPTERLNPAMIPSQVPGGTDGASYNYDDLDVASEVVYYYWLEDVDLDGTVSRYGPVMASRNVPTAVTLTGLQANSRAIDLPWPLLGLPGVIAAGWLLGGDRARSIVRQLRQLLKQRAGRA